MGMNLILNYLSELEKHNEREWYHAHKKEYQEATAEFEMLLEKLMIKLGKTEPGILNYQPKDFTFRLVRDTRFSHDKSPYLPAFRAHLSPEGKNPIPVGYFLYLMPGNRSFLGGGLFATMFKDATERIRRAIEANGEEFEQILTTKPFSDQLKVEGEKLKRVPGGYDPGHPQAEYLKHKSWFLEYPIEDEQMQDMDTFVDFATDIFLMMRPFHQFLNRALEGFEFPER